MRKCVISIRVLALVFFASATMAVAHAQYPYVARQPQVGPYGLGVQLHNDGGGITTRRGNEMLVERIDGTATYYRRNGDWEYRQHNNGVHGYYYYDDARQVQQFDYRNPFNGARVIGENPYPTNPYGRAWSQRGFGW
jgi:hypothetical protein